YEGGTLTAQEFLDFLRGRPPAFRGQVAAAPDDPLRQLLRDLTRAKLLVNDAREQGIDVTEDERSAMTGDARAFIVAAAERIGLRRIQPTDGESRDAALERKVLEAVTQVLRGEQEVVPLGIIAFTLRDRYDNGFYDYNISRILDLVGAARGAQTPPAQTPDSLLPAPNAPPANP
ncbi:MAG: hypothetical protein HY701_10885, partial [Gemmatimonadetes bacterium]|nr:hypothetical protein [Gemmatimonadota bacterium]